MKRTLIGLAISTLVVTAAASGAQAGEPTCAGLGGGDGWKNHGEHVLGYVNGDGAAGGAPAHLSARPDGPAPGASFCLDQANSPGWHL
jgi:hypothetical protein